MNTEPEYFEIAETDFSTLYRSEPREAEDRMVMLICDPELAAKRIIRLIKERLFAGLESDDDDAPKFDFSLIIEVLREHGPLPALRKNLVTFDELVRLANDPQALRLAHQAVIEFDLEAFDEQAPTVTVAKSKPNVPRIEPYAYTLSASSGEESEYDPFDSAPKAVPLPSLNRCFDDWTTLPSDEFVTLCQKSGIIAGETSLIPRFSGASANEDFSPGSQEVIVIENGRISLFAPLELIPDGLCRLTVMAIDSRDAVKKISMFLPLTLKRNHWDWAKSLLDMFGRDMSGFTIRHALETTAVADFRDPEVRKFVAALPDGDQKNRATKYLDEVL